MQKIRTNSLIFQKSKLLSRTLVKLKSKNIKMFYFWTKNNSKIQNSEFSWKLKYAEIGLKRSKKFSKEFVLQNEVKNWNKKNPHFFINGRLLTVLRKSQKNSSLAFKKNDLQKKKIELLCFFISLMDKKFFKGRKTCFSHSQMRFKRVGIKFRNPFWKASNQNFKIFGSNL